MNTILELIPSPGGNTEDNVQGFESWATMKAVETDVAYGINLVTSDNQNYMGSLKVVTEESANNAGTRRLLLKVELPIVATTTADSGTGCCCDGKADESEVPTVSAHVVITVPKAVARDLTRGETSGRDQVSAAIRFLQATLASVCHAKASFNGSNAGAVLAENLILTKADAPADTYNGGLLKFPLRYESSSDSVKVDVGVPADAPVWGLIGGLRPLA